MDSKQELVGIIKEWISCDNKIKQLQKAAKDYRSEKKILTEILVSVMKNNEIDCFDINDGKLVYSKNKVKTPLSKKHLMTALMSYYKDEPTMAEEISNFIMDSREEKVKESIKRKISKS